MALQWLASSLSWSLSARRSPPRWTQSRAETWSRCGAEPETGGALPVGVGGG